VYGHFHPAVIVAMASVMVVQVAVDQVIHVISMRHSFMAAVRAVSVLLVVSRTLMTRRALLRIGRVHLNAMVIYMVAMWVMQVTVVKIIGMSVVFYSRMAAIWAMMVAVISRMLMMSFRHGLLLSLRDAGPAPRIY
jgi:hypothetical protein